MTDGRIAGHWVGDPRFDEMSADAWCVFTKAITWSNERGTDGHVPWRYLPLLHPSGMQQAACNEVEEMGLWKRVDGGYQMVGWDEPTRSGGLGQETANRVAEQRQRRAEAQRRRREAARKKQSEASYEAGYEAGHVGQDQDEDRTRTKASYGEGEPKGRDALSGAPEYEEWVDPETGQRRQRLKAVS